MAMPLDIPQNINIQPIPIEKVVQTPKMEPGKNDVKDSYIDLSQKGEKGKRVNMDEESKKRKQKDEYKRSAPNFARSSEKSELENQEHLSQNLLAENARKLSKGGLLDVTI